MNATKKPQISEVIEAMRSPNSWRAYKKEQAMAIAGKVEKSKTEKFADFLDKIFISICEDLHVFDMARDWANRPDIEKLAAADDIIQEFVKRISIAAQTKQNSAENNDTNQVSDISVVRANDGLMSVSSNGNVNVNPKFPFYKDLVAFLMDLRHEATHIVDMFFPCLSPLDTDIRDRAIAFYVEAKEDMGLYSENPLELNANTGRKKFGEMVRAKIASCEYNRIRESINNAMGGIVRGH